MSNIRQLIKDIVKSEVLYSKVCKVISVDASKNTCVCEPIDGSSYYTDVIFSIGSTSNYVIIPKVDSTVIVNFIDKNVGYITMSNYVEKVKHNYTTGNNDSVKIDINTLFNDLKDAIKQYTTDIDNSLKAIVLPHYMGPTTGPPTNMAQFSAAKTSLDTAVTKFGDGIDTLYDKK